MSQTKAKKSPRGTVNDRSAAITTTTTESKEKDSNNNNNLQAQIQAKRLQSLADRRKILTKKFTENANNPNIKLTTTKPADKPTDPNDNNEEKIAEDNTANPVT